MAENDQARLRRRIAELEAELERFQRAGQFLEASEANLQLFARSLAHDFNNLLSAMLGHASLIESITPPGEETHEAAGVIRRAAERAGELTAQLLHFTRGGLGRTIPVDLHETIREVADLLRRTLDPEIRLKVVLQAESCIVHGDPGQIHQMLLNLALNARDAMPEGGELRMETTDLDPDREKPQLLLTVRDTGTGIAPDICPRIFEPFFTTKASGRNTGMGLAIVQRVVHSHAGTIRVDTVPGQGTAFHIALPLAQPAVRSGAAANAR
jgi:two-component system cell cycle sensor histidine kinase/response regulator CckA